MNHSKLFIAMTMNHSKSNLGDGEIIETHVDPVLEDCEVLELLHLRGSVLFATQGLCARGGLGG